MMESEKILSQRYETLAPHLIQALNRRGFDAFFCQTAREAADRVMAMIPEKSSVSWGGSISLAEAGLPERVKKGDYRALDRDSAKTPEERFELMRQALLCDVYLSSVNAMTEDGEMVNIDGVCNRIAAIAFGPKTVILIVGMNKVCRDLDAAKIRARTFAAPNNGFRCDLKLPCTKTGVCHDCHSAESMCSQIVEVRRNRIPGRIKVVLVGENLGL